jgi:hypothetical protein
LEFGWLRIEFSGPRLFNGLVRPGISFSARIRSRFFAMYYNFVCIHTTPQTTPAWRDRGLWEMTDVVEVLEVLEAWENDKYGYYLLALNSTICASQVSDLTDSAYC